jgi:tRNA (cytidine56-2'-O)-methyltransferase
MEIVVIRLGHRIGRDPRLTTHVALTARALGARKIVVCGEKEEGILNSIRDLSKRWGGKFQVQYSESWKKPVKTLKKKGYCIVHATMYGEPIQKKAKKLEKKRKIAIVVGSEKVPSEMYWLSDYNIAVTSQPHSEVAALAIILHEIQRGKELEKKFSNATIKIKPMARGKKVNKRE